jgi:hypothetical protein
LYVVLFLAGASAGSLPWATAAAAPRCAKGQACATTTAPSHAAATAALDLDGLETRLRETRAIGLFTKMSLKNQVDDLLEEFQEFHAGRGGGPLPRLRERFDLLVLKVLSLLQERDVRLARDIAASRDTLWALLADPRTFSTLRTQGRAGA